jgi:hypothetical protein
VSGVMIRRVPLVGDAPSSVRTELGWRAEARANVPSPCGATFHSRLVEQSSWTPTSTILPASSYSLALMHSPVFGFLILTKPSPASMSRHCCASQPLKSHCWRICPTLVDAPGTSMALPVALEVMA